ncbi:MAG: acylphosphatase [Aerococcus sp.]|nr:acylphosphatase [Aerococcus sp.]
MLTTTYRINGRVQGVGFRFTVMMVAQRLDLTGTVKNEQNGSVTVVLNATENEATHFIESLKDEVRRGFAVISTIDIVDQTDQTPESTFRIIY